MSGPALSAAFRRAACVGGCLLVAACGGGGGGSDRPQPAANRPPVAEFSVSTSEGPAPLTVSFDAGASRDADGTLTDYQWTFGDGSSPGSGVRVQHRFLEPGVYTARLTVTDDAGASRSAQASIRARGTTLSGHIVIQSTSAVDQDVNDRLVRPLSNDDFTTAQALPNPVRLGGFVNLPGTGADTGNHFDLGDPGDVYAINLSGNEQIVLNIAAPDAGLDLMLWDANGDPVDATAGVGSSRSLRPPAPGRYFVEVFPAEAADNPAGASNYVLSIGQDLSVQAVSAYRLSDRFVPGELLLPSTARRMLDTLDTRHGLVRATGGAGLDRFRLAAGTAARDQRLPGRRHDRWSAAQTLKYRTLLARRALSREPGLASTELNLLLEPHRVPNDQFFPLQWHLNAISAPEAWDLSTGERLGLPPVVVAVVDTGILPEHPDLDRTRILPGFDFISDASRARDGDGIDPDPRDAGDLAFGGSSSFHGTHVAGTAAAATNNGRGVAGVSWGADLMPLRALGVGGGSNFDVVQAIRYAAGLENASGRLPTRRADVINLSLGSPVFSQFAQDAITEASQAGVVLVASAGNESSARVSYPAAYDGVVAVSATTIENQLAPYSNFGAIDVAAPGGYNATDLNGDGFGDGVWSTLGDDSLPGTVQLGYASLNGTSMAAPHVAGVVALMRAVYPGLTPLEFDAALRAGELTDDLGPAGFDAQYGQGLINAQKAVLSALARAGGAGTDPGPVLASSRTSIDLGVQVVSQTVTLSNLGTGDLVLLPPVADETWVSVEPVTDAVDDVSGLGDYRLSVNRGGLVEGAYQAQVRFSPTDPTLNSVTVAVTMRVPGEDPDADAGLLYVIVVDDRFEVVGPAAVARASNGSYTFQLDDVPAGSYRLFAGSDMDDDGFLCDAGEACGAYRTLDSLEIVTVDPTTALEMGNLDFFADFRAVVTDPAAAARTTAAAPPPQGIRYR